MWGPTTVTADSKLEVSLVVGKYTQAQTHALVHDARHRLHAGHVPATFTDAYAGLDHGVGHLVEKTDPGHQCLDPAKG